MLIDATLIDACANTVICPYGLLSCLMEEEEEEDTSWHFLVSTLNRKCRKRRITSDYVTMTRQAIRQRIGVCIFWQRQVFRSFVSEVVLPIDPQRMTMNGTCKLLRRCQPHGCPRSRYVCNISWQVVYIGDYVVETGASPPTGHVRHLALISLQFFYW